MHAPTTTMPSQTYNLPKPPFACAQLIVTTCSANQHVVSHPAAAQLHTRFRTAAKQHCAQEHNLSLGTDNSDNPVCQLAAQESASGVSMSELEFDHLAPAEDTT